MSSVTKRRLKDDERQCLILVSDTARSAEHALRSAAYDAGFIPTEGEGSSVEAVIAQVDCVIAEVSSQNFHTTYSLGVARALGRPVLLVGRKGEPIPTDLASLEVLLYEDDPESLRQLRRTASRMLSSFDSSTGVRRLAFAARNERLFAVDWDRLNEEDIDNLCVELLTQMGFRKVQWEPRIKEFDLVAELPKKDPDGFDFSERWYVTLGRNAPPEMLLDMLREPDYFFHRLMRYSDGPSRELLPSGPVAVLAILIREGVQRRLFEFEDRLKRGKYPSANLRLRVWDRNYLTSLVYRFPQIGFKYFSEEGQARAKYRKTIEELYAENVDLTQEKSAALAALQDERNKRVRAERDAIWKDISFSAAHKIGNPLFAIETNLDPLLKRIGQNRREEAEVVVQHIRNSVEKAKGIIDQFKSLTRAQELKPVPTVLRPIFEDACGVARERGVSCEIDCDPSLQVLADPDRLSECFDELVSNSLHWLDKLDKTIRIDAVVATTTDLPEGLTEGQYVRIRFCDNGKGIPLENKERIFNAFFTTWEHGTGLGLALVRRIVEGLGGAILESGVPEQGALFEIVLPMAPTKNQEAKKESK